MTGLRIKGRDLIKYGLATHYIGSEDGIKKLYDDLKTKVTFESSNEEIENIVTLNSE
jgi:hypothetical protein